jgi:hypothetical protein
MSMHVLEAREVAAVSCTLEQVFVELTAMLVHVDEAVEGAHSGSKDTRPALDNEPLLVQVLQAGEMATRRVRARAGAARTAVFHGVHDARQVPLCSGVFDGGVVPITLVGVQETQAVEVASTSCGGGGAHSGPQQALAVNVLQAGQESFARRDYIHVRVDRAALFVRSPQAIRVTAVHRFVCHFTT